jgi:SulP family sulfate permease
MAQAISRAGGKRLTDKSNASGDIWGGLAATLVALPGAIAFGVTVYAVIGPSYAAYGAVAGIIGAAIIGLVASTFGGTDRLISTPCAPAAAVLSAFAIELVKGGTPPEQIVLLLLLLGMLTGMMQMLFGFVGVGKLIKYIPYPVVSGYLTGVGLIIIGSQIPKFLGSPGGTKWWQALLAPENWNPNSLVVGAVTISVTLLAPRVTQKVPGTIIGIVAGVATYFGLATQFPALFEVKDNPLIIGPLGLTGDGFLASLTGRWKEIGDIRLGQVAALMGSALTLAVLLSIDTLKTCVILDKMTRSHHESNRELVAQGAANFASSALGGMNGAGQMGATLVCLNSGATSRTSGIYEGIFTLLAALILSSVLQWVPIATLAGILIVIGIRMIDRESFRLIESQTTRFDFGVIVIVVLVALTIGLIAASGAGVMLAILLFVREQIGTVVVRHKMYVNQMSSTWHRSEEEMGILAHKGDQGVIFELQGSLFFGNTSQLYNDLEHEIASRHFVIIDFKRVQSIDVTAANLFNMIRDAMQERGARLLLSNVKEKSASGRNLKKFLQRTGLIRAEEGENDTVRVFADLDTAIEWVEERILGEREVAPVDETPMQLQEMPIFAKHKDETLKDLETRLQMKSFKSGEAIYSTGEPGDALYWVRKGAVHLIAPLGAGRTRRIASFGRGEFFGGLAYLSNQPRGNDAVAQGPTEVYVLSREQFNLISDEHKKLAFNLLAAISRSLASRCGYAENELAMMQEY